MGMSLTAMQWHRAKLAGWYLIGVDAERRRCRGGRRAVALRLGRRIDSDAAREDDEDDLDD